MANDSLPPDINTTILYLLMRRAGVTEIIVTPDDVIAFAGESIRIEGLTVGKGLRVCLVPRDPVLNARLVYQHLQSIMRQTMGKPVRDPGLAQVIAVARAAYGETLAHLDPEQLARFTTAMSHPVTDAERAYRFADDAATPARRGILTLVDSAGGGPRVAPEPPTEPDGDPGTLGRWDAPPPVDPTDPGALGR